MPVYRYVCSLCSTSFKKILSVEDFKSKPVYCKCKAIAIHDASAATSQAMEVLDDGINRRIERYSEAERLFKEREYEHKLKYGELEIEDD